MVICPYCKKPTGELWETFSPIGIEERTIHFKCSNENCKMRFYVQNPNNEVVERYLEQKVQKLIDCKDCSKEVLSLSTNDYREQLLGDAEFIDYLKRLATRWEVWRKNG